MILFAISIVARSILGLSTNFKIDLWLFIFEDFKWFLSFGLNEKKATIISSIIKKGSSKNKSCFLAQDTKYPDLVNEYNNIYKTINPLRSKLDLPPSSDLKSICN